MMLGRCCHCGTGIPYGTFQGCDACADGIAPLRYLVELTSSGIPELSCCPDYHGQYTMYSTSAGASCVWSSTEKANLITGSGMTGYNCAGYHASDPRFQLTTSGASPSASFTVFLRWYLNGVLQRYTYRDTSVPDCFFDATGGSQVIPWVSLGLSATAFPCGALNASNSTLTLTVDI